MLPGRTVLAALSLLMLLGLRPSVGATPAPLDVVPPVMFQGNMESGSLSGWLVSGNSPQVTRERARVGVLALKTVLNYNTSPTRYRTEVRAEAPDPEYGKDYWYGFSIFLPAEYVPDTVWEIVAQWHDIPDVGEDTRNPMLSLTTTNGRWGVSSRWDDKPITQLKPGVAGTQWQYAGSHSYDLGAYETGRWTDWVFHLKWSYIDDKTGVLQIWKDGVLVADQVGPNCYNDARGPYFKMGLYKGWTTSAPRNVSERTLFHDEFRMAGPGARYEDVAPGGGKISGIPKPGTPDPPAAVTVN
jgi:hypothetical protein